MYLIDTDVLIWLLRAEPTYTALFQRLRKKTQLSLSVITIMEVYKNILPVELIKTEEIVKEFISWDVTVRIAKQAGLYWQQYIKEFKNLHIADCLIAATAREQNIAMITLNIRHFPMSDITVIHPSKL